MHELLPVEEAEVTGIVKFGERQILSVGWNRKIVLHDESDADVCISD